jgi:trimeric autotransporter adhesin
MINQVVEPIGKNLITKTNLEMKSITLKLTIILLTLLFAGSVFPQGVVISDSTNATPHGSAMMDLQSVDKGFLPPRMTTLDRTNIVNPASGLVVYDTDKESLFLFNGTDWKPLVTGSGSQWEADGEDIYRNTGNVGIGTDSPNTLLHTIGLGTGQGNILFEGEAKLLLPPMYGPPPASGSGTRMMWYPDKVAFRVGLVTDSQWDSALIGPNSYAFGINPIASGHSSMAFGRETYAPSFNETVIGAYNTSYTPQGIGLFSWNGSDRLFVVGNGTAENQRSDALVLLKNGNLGLGTSFPQSTMHINGSFRYEDGNQAEGKVLTSDEFGNVTWANPTSGVEIDPVFNASPAASIGNSNINNWNDAFSWGDHNQAGYLLEENDPTVATIQPGSVPRWNGNELEDSDVYIQNGQLGIGTVTPDALLHVNGTGSGEGNILFTGVYKIDNPGDAPVEGTGTRMMWYPDKAAFRVGHASSTQWDTDSTGNFSFAAGFNTKASGSGSTALGSENTASGIYSTALGYYTTASGYASIAMGLSTNAEGQASNAMGYATSAPSFAETVIGSYNTDYTPVSMYMLDENDRLFVIGNGTAPNNQSDAMVVLKNGNVGIGTSNPAIPLHVETSTSATAIYGNNTSNSGQAYGGYFESNSSQGYGIEAIATSNSGTTYAGFFGNYSTSGRAVVGDAFASTGITYGVTGNVNSPNGFAAFFTGAIGSRNYFQRNVGIGTLNPGELLEVAGNIHVSGGNRTIFNRSNNSLAIGTNNTERIHITNGGNVGVATSTPGELLEVNGNIHVSGGDRTIFNRSNNSLAFGTNNTERIHITNGGNVGVATSTPGELLEVNGNIHVSGGDRTIFNRSNNSLAFGTNNSERMRITNTGNVGIGTDNPGYMLHVMSSSPSIMIENSGTTPAFLRFLRAGDGANDNYIALGSSGQMVMRVSGTDRMTIRESGNVGIGIGSPSFLLHVNGDAGKPGGGSWATASDARLKSDVQDLQGSLENILKLRGVTFLYNDPEAIHELPGERMGMIAQEVAEVFPDWVSEAGDGYLRLTYRGFEALMVEALRELRAEKDTEIESLKSRLTALEALMDLPAGNTRVSLD